VGGAALPLGTRLFLIAGALIGVPLAIAMLVTSLRAHASARQLARDDLEVARSAWLEFDRQRFAQLKLIANLVATDPNFVAYVAEGDPASTADLLSERRASLGCDFAIVLDPAGHVVARTDRPGATGEDLSREALVAVARQTGEAHGAFSDGRRLYSAVAVALLSGRQNLEGTLVAGFATDDAMALNLKRLTGTETCFLVSSGEGAHVIASTLGEGTVRLPSALGPALPNALAGRGTTVGELALERQTWSARVEPIRDAADSTVGAIVSLASLDAAAAPFRSVQAVLLVVGLLAMLGAFAVTWTLSRRVTRPLERLAVAAEAARAGRYELPEATDRKDEIGRLASSFRALLGELREERDVATYLGAVSRTLPDPVPVTPSPRGGGADTPTPGGGVTIRVQGAGSSTTIAPGDLLGGRFEVLSILGAGGMGTVYRTRDRELNDVVALKTLTTNDPASIERLKGEVRLARRITHRNVVRTHDFGEVDGVPFLSMEFVRGVTLRELITHGGAPPITVGLRLARQIAAGLEAAHAIGVIHRDLKPENVIVDTTGDAKLTDFGVSGLVLHRGERTDRFTGTLSYAAPEVMQGAEADARSDLYSFGVLLFELFSGRRPFLANDENELAYRMMNESPPSLRELNLDVPESLERVVLVALARDPVGRWASAAEMRRALEDVRVA
jgi:serine/threonine-protein kinase